MLLMAAFALYISISMPFRTGNNPEEERYTDLQPRRYMYIYALEELHTTIRLFTGTSLGLDNTILRMLYFEALSDRG